MTAKTVAGNPGSNRRQFRKTPTVGGPRTMQSVVINTVTQALTDDDSAGQG